MIQGLNHKLNTLNHRRFRKQCFFVATSKQRTGDKCLAQQVKLGRTHLLKLLIVKPLQTRFCNLLST